MRIPLIAGNWKMNTTVSEAEQLVYDMLDQLDNTEKVDKVLCPPFVSLVPLSMMLQGSSVGLGAQNMFFERAGAYTGEISPAMLAELCEFVILGHSERRWYFGETDELVCKKVKAALTAKLKPILCVGERLDDNEGGRTEQVVGDQVKRALDGADPTDELVIAYEPVWAIGSGKAATGAQAGATIGFIRGVVGSVWGAPSSRAIRILYGGSVTGNNIDEFVTQADIDGALVGGASLKADEFVAIVRQTAAIHEEAAQK